MTATERVQPQTTPLVELDKHTGVQKLLFFLKYFDDAAFAGEGSNTVALAVGVEVTKARAELQALVDDQCRRDMAWADEKQKMQARASQDVAGVWSELHELRVVHDAFVEHDKVKDKTIARLTKERDTALAAVDHAEVHHDEHHAREDALALELSQEKERNSSMLMKAALAVNADVDNAIDALPAIEAKVLDHSRTIAFLQERTAAQEHAVVENIKLGEQVRMLEIMVDSLSSSRDEVVAQKTTVEVKNAEMQKDLEAVRANFDVQTQKDLRKLRAAGEWIGKLRRCLANLVGFAKSKVTVVDAHAAITEAESCLQQKDP